MAINNFKIFNEQNNNVLTDQEYEYATQRLSGVIPGIADAPMHNKLYRQTSVMAAAIAKVLFDAGLDANDADWSGLAKNIKELFVSKPLDAYPVGAIYISTSSVSPATLFGGTWEAVRGRFLLAESASYPAGSTGGEATHILSANEMPKHTHNASTASAGAHTHGASIASAGAHTHTRGTMNITGAFGADDRASNYTTGAFSKFQQSITNTSADGGDSTWYAVNFDASKTWTGSTSSAGAHTHTVTINSAGEHIHPITVSETGASAAHNNMPPYLAVYVWKRTA